MDTSFECIGSLVARAKPKPDISISHAFLVPYKEEQEIERMVRRNEKSLLRAALADIRARAGNQLIVEDSWYRAAGHKHGKGVVDLLRQAGVAFGQEKPIFLAIERKLWDVAEAMAPGLERLSHLDPDRTKTPHLLVMAAKHGHVDMLRALFGKPCSLVSWMDKDNQALCAKDKANFVLRLLAMDTGNPAVDAGALRGVVEFLVEQGADPNFRTRDGYSIELRGSVLSFAAKRWNTPLLRLLVELGADPVAPNEPDTGHMHGNSQQCLLEGMRARMSNLREWSILPEQWETMEFLASCGVSPDPRVHNEPFGRLSPMISEESKARITAMVAQVALEKATPKLSTALKGRRL